MKTYIYLQNSRGGGTIIRMTPEEKAQKINEIYENAIRELEILKAERKSIIKEYIDELEAAKLAAIRESLNALSTNNH